MDEYKLRKDIDSLTDIANQLSLILEENDVANLQELLGRFYDKSEVDVDLSVVVSDLDTVSESLDVVSNDLTVLNEDLYDAEGHLKVTEEDLNAAKQSITNLSGALTNLRNDLTSAEATLDDLEADLQTTSSSLTTALSDLETLETQLNDAKGRITTAENNITSANQSITNHQNAISDLNDDLDDAKDRITATEQSLETANESISNHQISINNLNNELIDADDRLTTTEQNISSLRTSLNSLSGDLTILADMLTGFTGTLQEFDAELVRQGIDKTELNEDIYKLVSQICLVRQDISDTDQKIDDTVDDINNLDTSVVPNLKNKISEAKASGDTAQQDLATAKTDINNLNSTTFPNLKNKIDEAKASGDTAQSQLAQTKTDLEDLNNTVFPNLVGAIDDAQASGDTAQSNLTNAITEINNVTAQGGTFANLHGSINAAQTAADDAQDNLDKSIDDIENLTGTVFPNLKNHIETAQTDIATAQGDISQAQTDIGNAQRDISTNTTNLNTIIQTNSSWQILYIGATDATTLNSLVLSTGLQLQNIHYAYDSTFKINDGVSWKSYSSNVILSLVEFGCAVCDGFNQDIRTIADNFEIITVYDTSNGCFYQKSGNTWSQVLPANYDYYQKMCVMTMFNTTPLNNSSSLSGSVQLQSAVNDELYSKINNFNSWINDFNSGGIVMDYNPYLRLVHYYGNLSYSVTTSEVMIDEIPTNYLPKGDKIQLCHNNLNYPTMVRIKASDGHVVVHGTNSGTRDISFDFLWRY